jgi:AAA15 family ATPase/GTPase
MLIGFTLRNFLSFLEENTFSLMANKDKDYEASHLIKTRHGNILKSALIFGANASGKTNFFVGLDCMKNIVLADHINQSRLIAKSHYFLFNEETANQPTLFEVRFLVDEVIYEYGFEIFKGEINKEYLNKQEKRTVSVFSRTSPDKKDITVGKLMRDVKKFVENTRRDNLFLYHAVGGDNAIAKTVFEWFQTVKVFYTNALTNKLDATVNYIGNDTERKNKILDLVNQTDTGIKTFDFSIAQEKKHNELFHITLSDDDKTSTSINVYAKHDFYNKNWEKISDISIHLNSESAGTKKLFYIAGPIIEALETGSVVLIDEIDSKLHALLVRTLITPFNSRFNNPKNAQLICNTHNLLLLEDQIRHDQINFIEKDEFGRSSFYCLADFKGVRGDENIMGKYLLGAYGAIPRVKDYII